MKNLRFTPWMFLFSLIACAPQAHGFTTLWTLGTANNDPMDFSDSQNGTAPGSTTANDSDYYFAGVYAAPIGTVASNEPISQFGRDIHTWAPNKRIHFMLNGAQATSTLRIRFTADLMWGGFNGGSGFGQHQVTLKMNGNTIATKMVTSESTLMIEANADSFTPIVGANTLELIRSGGEAQGWVSFDYLQLEIFPQALQDQDADGMPLWWELDHGLRDDVANGTADADGDGVNNLTEFTRGTDPRNADSDDDGLSDSAENTANTNPLIADTDGDSLRDGEELALVPALNPLLPDTDGDSASDAWEIRTGYLATSASSTPPAFTGAIGLQFVSELSPDDALSSRSITGLIPQENWNRTKPLSTWNATTGSTTEVASPISSSLVNAHGQATGVTYARTGGSSWFSGNSLMPLFSGYMTTNGNTPGSITFSNIPYASYDVVVYTGTNAQTELGYIRLNDQSATDQFFASSTTAPVQQFTENLVNQSTRPWRANTIRFRNVTGGSCNIKWFRSGTYNCGVHAIQIIAATPDSDGDSMPDWWEFQHRLSATSNDASADADLDGKNNLAEYLQQTSPRDNDTDDDGLADGVETTTNPRLADTDSDGLSDGFEVQLKPFATNPLLADSDSDGRTDAAEIADGTNPIVANASNDAMPVVTLSPRTFTWRLDQLQLIWDHDRSHLAAAEWNDAYLLNATVVNHNTPDQWASLRFGIRHVQGKLVHFFYSDHLGAFSDSNAPSSDIWDSDWSNNPVDLRAGLGFSGLGPCDLSDRLRIELTGTSSGSQNGWTVTYTLRNLDTNVVVKTFTKSNCSLPTAVHNNTATWDNEAGQSNRVTIETAPGVRAVFSATRLDTTPAYAAWLDADNDGMPNAWEISHSFQINLASDAANDADGDGLSNVREFLAGTHPHQRDTDGDGCSDLTEVMQGSNALLASSKPPFPQGLPAGLNGEDFNNNGMSDAWEWAYLARNVNANDDADADGQNNLAEAAAGTDPFDPASRLYSRMNTNANNLMLRWPALSDKQHRIETSDSLVSNWSTLSTSTSTIGQEYEATIVRPSNAKMFYRVIVNDKDTDGDGVSDWTEKHVLDSDAMIANSLRSVAPYDTNNDGIAESSISGDQAALMELLEGGTASGGYPGGAGGNISRVHASRFLMQSTFGPTDEDINAVILLGYEGWINAQIALPATQHSAYAEAITADYFGARTDTSYNRGDGFLFGNNLQTAFARAAVAGEDQLRQRVAFALSQILVASRRDANLENRVLGMAHFYDIFVRHAFGNYEDILHEVALHPCMGRYLSHLGNQKANPSINQYPDENFAREVMQLFTIGLWELNPDGTRQLDVSGHPIPTYSNTDITQLARVFTGLWYSNHLWGHGGWSETDFATPMGVHADRHDFGQKTLLDGKIIPSRASSEENARRDIEDAIRLLFEHPNTAPFICRQLIQFLVTDNPSPAYVGRISAVFSNNGSGKRGDLSAVVKAILLDQEARDPAFSHQPAFGRLKEPVIRTMALARACGMKKSPKLLWWDWNEYFGSSRQEPGYSPSVFNFYRPDYLAPGLLTQNNLSGPVFQITDSFSSIAFPNRIWRDINEGFSMWRTYSYPFDLSQHVMLAQNPDQLLDRLNTLLCGGGMSASSRTIIRNAILAIPNTQPEARARVALYLVMVSPEGAVMR